MGAALLLICALLLAAVLATAGAAKLLDLEGSRSAVVAFGVPPRLARALGILLPVAELATAALLASGALSSPLARAGGTSAFVLLALFSVAIAASLVRGRAPDCHCFGQLHSAPAGPRTLARNGGLLTLAAFVATAGDPLPTAVVGIVALALLAVVLLHSRNQAAERAEQPASDGLPLGTPAPGFRLPGLAGDIHTLDSLRGGGRAVLLLFTDPGCGPCIELAPKVAGWQREDPSGLTIAVIERRDGQAQAGQDKHGRRNVLFQHDGEVADSYRAQGTPTAVLVGADGTIASPVAGGAAQIEALVARNVERLESLQATVVRRQREPARFGRPLIRRELLVRGAGAWAALSAVLAWPARAAATAASSSGRGCPERDRCGSKCCGPLQECRGQPPNKHCECPSRHFVRDKCGQNCTNFKDDNNNCGGCVSEGRGAECIAGRSTCIEGKCVPGDGSTCNPRCRESGEVCCDGKCVRLAWNENNCGSCGHRCTEGRQPKCCDGRCRDIKSDPRHCGDCFEQCPKEKPICHPGADPEKRCRDKCPEGLRVCKREGNPWSCYRASEEVCCNGMVFAKEDTQSDSRHCGPDCRECSGPFDTGECCNGTCCDINAATCCPGGCKNIDHDEKNCGRCGKVCGPKEFCRFGTCSE